MMTQKPFKLTDKQSEAIKLLGSEAAYILLYGGSRSTKTFRFNHVKSSIVYDTFPKVMQLCFPEVQYKLDKSDWFVTYSNGSQIWFGGLDDKERTEKVLGNEYASICLNEISQISYQGFLILVTRLAQVCTYERGGKTHELRQKMYFDENPPSKGHWSHKLFIEKKDPDTNKPLKNPDDYVSMLMNPKDNAENLSKAYLKALQNLPKRQRDRFWDGKFGDNTENALWTDDIIEKSRVDSVPDGVSLVRVVVAVDPSGASDDENANNDDIGIGVAGIGSDGIGYVFEDLTVKAGPATWGKIAASAYERHDADRVVAETNFGGAMVEFVVKTANPNISYKAVSASRGKTVRAEPISALHETGKIKMVGKFDELEDELLAFTTTGYTGARSPNRADWFVWAFTELFPGIARPVHDHEPIEIPRRVGFR
jgi:hypothetical protein